MIAFTRGELETQVHHLVFMAVKLAKGCNGVLDLIWSDFQRANRTNFGIKSARRLYTEALFNYVKTMLTYNEPYKSLGFKTIAFSYFDEVSEDSVIIDDEKFRNWEELNTMLIKRLTSDERIAEFVKARAANTELVGGGFNAVKSNANEFKKEIRAAKSFDIGSIQYLINGLNLALRELGYSQKVALV